MEVGASCRDGIHSWPLPRWGCCLLGGISKKLLWGTAVGVWDKWRLLLRSPRTTNAGLLSCRNWCSGDCTWGGVGTGRKQTKLHVQILEWGKMKLLSYSLSVSVVEYCTCINFPHLYLVWDGVIPPVCCRTPCFQSRFSRVLPAHCVSSNAMKSNSINF
jgi:hypothetical protein